MNKQKPNYENLELQKQEAIARFKAIDSSKQRGLVQAKKCSKCGLFGCICQISLKEFIKRI